MADIIEPCIMSELFSLSSIRSFRDYTGGDDEERRETQSPGEAAAASGASAAQGGIESRGRAAVRRCPLDGDGVGPASGPEALKSRGRWGRRRGLDDAQRQALAEALKAGALAAGFATELWTLPRIGVLIQRLFGRRYSDSQVWRILQGMGFSPQRPTRRALERDEAAIRQWKKRWPGVKKTPQRKAGP